MKLLDTSNNAEIKDWYFHPQELVGVANWLMQQKNTARNGEYVYYQAWHGFYTAWKNVLHASDEHRGRYVYDYLELLDRAYKKQARVPTTQARKEVARIIWNQLCDSLHRSYEPHEHTFLHWNNTEWVVYQPRNKPL